MHSHPTTLPHTHIHIDTYIHTHTHIYTYIHTYIHTYIIYIHTYIPWIRKFVTATVGCGISHKDTKHTDICSNNKTKTTQNDEIIDNFFNMS